MAYANRSRRLYRAGGEEAPAPSQGGEILPRGSCGDEPKEPVWVTARRRSWARLIKRIYTVDPLVCPRCGHELKIVAAITDPVVIDRILAHRKLREISSPFEPRAPPAA
ncbi:MAG: hypothetical protein O2894_13505 [Planctomycetota bacterium]|nr:hypothetical protein [Planctomycetota bacterium]